MNNVLIRGGTVVTMDPARPLLEDGWITVEGQHIAGMGAGSPPNRTAAVIIEAAGKIVMPGLVNAHLHVRPGRAMGDGLSHIEWHSRYADGYSGLMTPAEAYAGALLAFGECLTSGTTCVMPMPVLCAAVGRAAAAIGIRATIAPHGGDDPPGAKGLERLEDILALMQAQGDPTGRRIRYWLGFDNLTDCTRAYLAQMREGLARYPVGLHTHLNETAGRIAATKRKFGDLPTHILDREGLLSPRTALAHGVHLEAEEKDLLRRTGAHIVHNPVSNMRLGNGVAPVAELLDLGINVCLGTDGMLSAYKLDHFETMRVAAMLQRVTRLDSQVLPAQRVLEMATVNGARALGLEAEIGSVKPGKRADLIVLDARRLHMTPRARGVHDNLSSLLVYAAHGSDVETVLVDGEIVVKERRLTRVDEARVRADAQAASDRILADIPAP